MKISKFEMFKVYGSDGTVLMLLVYCLYSTYETLLIFIC